MNNTPNAYELAKRTYKKVPKDFKIAAISTFAIGLLTHMFVYVNVMFMGDGIRYYEYNPYTGFGHRWMVQFFTWFTKYQQLTWVLGILELALLGVCVFLLYRMFCVKRTLSRVLLTALVVTFPTITANHAYLLSAPSYAAALLLSILSVYFILNIKKRILGMALSTVSLLLMLSTYQAYVTCAVALIIILLMRKILFEAEKPKNIIFAVLRFAIALGVAAVAYFLLIRFLAQIGGIPLYTRGVADGPLFSGFGEFINSVYWAVRKAVVYYVKPGESSYYPVLSTVAFWLIGAAGVGLTIYTVAKNKIYKSKLNLALLAVLAIVLPLAINMLYVTINTILQVHVLMQFSFALPLIYVISLMDTLLPKRETAGEEIKEPQAKEGKKKKMLAVTSWVVVLAFVVVLFNNWILANSAYMGMKKAYDESLLLANRVVYTMESTEGYSNQLPVCLIGNLGGANYPFTRTGFDNLYNMVGAGYPLSYSIIAFLPWFLNEQMGIVANDQGVEFAANMATDPRVQAMPIFPTPGYVSIIDGILVVKFS